jgi:hypothetical protein
MIDPGRGDYGPVDPVQQMVDITKRAGARLREAGFRKTRFMVGTEETEEVSLRVARAILSDPGARPYVGAIGYHSYPYGEGYSSASFILSTSGAGKPDAGRVAVRDQLRDLGNEYHVNVWMTENSHGGPPLSYNTFRACVVQIHDEFLYADASAYFGEEAMWDLTSQRLHFKNGDLYGDSEGNIVLINDDTGAVDITGIGYAIGMGQARRGSGRRDQQRSSRPGIRFSRRQPGHGCAGPHKQCGNPQVSLDQFYRAKRNGQLDRRTVYCIWLLEAVCGVVGHPIYHHSSGDERHLDRRAPLA